MTPSADPPATTVEQLAVAARARGVFVQQGEDDEGGYLIVNAHGGEWLIWHDTSTILGWVAGQAVRDPEGDWRELPETRGWLGALDLEPETVLGNLLEASELPTDLYLREPPVSIARRRDPAGRAMAAYGVAEASDVFARCPVCTLTAQAEAMTYPTGREGRPLLDEAGPRGAVEFRCGICSSWFDARGMFVPATELVPCLRCQAESPAPPDATRVRCTSCGLYGWHPRLTREQRGRIAELERASRRPLLERDLAARAWFLERQGLADASKADQSAAIARQLGRFLDAASRPDTAEECEDDER